MQIMICLRGEDEQLPYLPEIVELGAGIELGSYGLIGIQSEKAWEDKFQQHQKFVNSFPGKIALHGPFIGMEYNHVDYIIRNAIQTRLDMTFDTARRLQAGRVILHSGFQPEYTLFKLEAQWLARNCDYWIHEIPRWENVNIQVVIENDIDTSPDLLVQLINDVNNPYLGCCLDIGHLNVFSKIESSTWVRAMGNRLYHVHVHDNDGDTDRHWPLGKGSIDFDSFYEALATYSPQATVSLEVEDTIEIKIQDLRNLAKRLPL